MASPGVVSDSNGFFHPVGDHAQTQFSIDNQPITDQQSRLYSNQISQDAVQSMEVITGVAPAEYGDKSSLVVHIVTKSGLDQAKPTGSASFGTARSRVRRVMSTSAPDRTRWAISCRCPDCEPTAFSTRPSSKRCTTPATTLLLRPIRLSARHHRHDSPERSGCASRDSTCRTPTIRSPRHSTRTSHVQHRAGLLARDRLEHAVHGEWFRSSGPSHVSAQRRSARRHARVGQSGSHADEHGRESRPVDDAGHPQREIRRLDRRDAAARAVHIWHHRPDRARIRGRGRELQLRTSPRST